MRKIIIPIQLLCFAAGAGLLPSLMAIWNQNEFWYGIPVFFIGIWAIAGVMVASTLLLYWCERKDNADGE